jgi:hypothetical protein
MTCATAGDTMRYREPASAKAQIRGPGFLIRVLYTDISTLCK